MANNPKRTAAVANAAADAAVALANGGSIRIYDGSQPATAATAVSGQTLLAELTLGNPAFGSAANGVATANSITADSSANATGTAAWFRAVSSGGTGLWDGTVGTSGADLNLNSVSLVLGGNVSVTSFTFTESLG
jgi:hypothetical protein